MSASDAPLRAVLSAPTFSIGIRCTEEEITEIVYLPPQAELEPRSSLAREAVRQLRAYLDDPRSDFSLPLAAAGTKFQRQVWQGIAAIPLSQTHSYAALARALGSSARAVGNACGANPYPIVIPCHRVIASDGGLGGFARSRGGFLLEVKRWLLTHEGARR